MVFSDPQILHMVLILPSLFGLMLLWGGVRKLYESEPGGLTNTIFGILVLVVVVILVFVLRSL